MTDSLLMVVTLVALAMALGMGVIVVTLLRDERRRSDARVAALSEMAAIEPPPPAAAVGGEQPRLRQHEEPPPAPERLVVSDDFELRASAATIPAGEMFVEPDRHSPWAGRVGAAAAVAVVIVGVAVTVIARRPAGDAGIDPANRAQTAAQPSGSLELLSLQHAQKVDTLTITGLVQNSREASPLSKVSVTAFLFAADGTFLASGRAPLDFTILGPGDESGFVVAIPVSVPVARYRVGFRGEDGRVIGHVDRRDTATMALNGK